MKAELYEWAIQLIQNSPTDHIFNKQQIRTLLESHVVGKMDHSRKLWTIFIFMIWHQIYVEKLYEFGHQQKSVRQLSMI